MAQLLSISTHSAVQWTFWNVARALSTVGDRHKHVQSRAAAAAAAAAAATHEQLTNKWHHVVPAEVAQHVAQHGRGLVRLPEDMVQTLDGYFKDAGLTGKRAKLRTLALTEQLKALSRSQAKGGLQPYRRVADSAAASPAAHQQAVMTREQQQEQVEMEAELEKMAAAFGPEALQRHRQARAAAVAAAELPLHTTRSGRLKAKAKKALLSHIEAHGMLSVSHEHVRAALDLPPSSTLAQPDRTLAIKQATPAYNETQALAYALARLPGCYAASMRIFNELAVRLPGFRPKMLLDFGAGPGTASWAAQEAWPESLSRLTAVEPSAAMRRLGERLEAARRFAHPHAPMVHWRAELPPAPRGQRKSQQRQQSQYDVVVASYVLGEVADPHERAALVRHLWGLTTDLLVLIEPGTPAGATNIQDARADVLQLESRRAAKLRHRSASAPADGRGSIAADGVGAKDGKEQQHYVDPNLASKLGSKWYGAHVVSPCPHDGPCPLAVPGSKAWCHFGTRFQRPSFMQAAKALPGTHVNPMDHQDERYSYVVIRRGTRPAVTQIGISRNLSGGRLASNAAHDHAANSEVSDDGLPTGQMGTLHIGRQANHNSAALAEHFVQPTGSKVLAEKQTSLFQQHPQLLINAPQPETATKARIEASASNVDLFTSDEMQQLSCLIDARAVQATQAHSEQVRGTLRGEHFHRVNSKLDAYGEGLVNQLMALEDEGIDWIDGSADGLPAKSALAAQQHAKLPVAAGMEKSIAVTQFSQNSNDIHETHTVESSREPSAQVDLHSLEGHDPLNDNLEMVRQAADASINWSRIIRPPRKRGGHVILDLCSPRIDHDDAICARKPNGHWPLAGGQIRQHVVARSHAKKWMGKAAYQMAHDAEWGDLWPNSYHMATIEQAVQENSKE